MEIHLRKPVINNMSSNRKCMLSYIIFIGQQSLVVYHYFFNKYLNIVII